jgi:hypothetical protein
MRPPRIERMQHVRRTIQCTDAAFGIDLDRLEELEPHVARVSAVDPHEDVGADGVDAGRREAIRGGCDRAEGEAQSAAGEQDEGFHKTSTSPGLGGTLLGADDKSCSSLVGASA